MSPINKPYDRLAKELSDEAPALLLRVLPFFADHGNIVIRPLRPETSPPVRLVDLVAALAVEGDREFIFHLEFCISYDADVLAAIACYGGSLATQYRTMRVDSVLVLLDRRRGAAAVPEVSEFVNHGTRIQHAFRTVRMWELDPAPILESEDIRFVSWALVMNSSPEQVSAVAARIRQSGDEEAAARFLTLGSLRYDREELERMLGGAHMGLMEAIMKGSSLVHDLEERAAKAAALEAAKEALAKGRQEGLEQGLEKGLEQGVERGLEQGRRDMLRAALRERFPGLELDPAIDALAGRDAIARILTATFTSTDRAELERLLRDTARPSN